MLPQPAGRAGAVLAFPGLGVVAADVDPGWVHAELADGDLSAPLNPPFLTAVCHKLGRRVNNIDVLLLGTALDGAPELPLTEVADTDHPRVRRAHRYRDDVRVWTTQPFDGSGRLIAGSASLRPLAAGPGGLLILGRGLAGRWEAAVEVDEGARNAGLGRRLAVAARHLSPADRPIWAQVAPGNAASVRAFLSAGYLPVGAEALLVS